MTELTVNLQKTFNAPVNKVFEAWLDANLLAKFMRPMSDMPELRVEADGKQGGRFTIYMLVDGKEVPHSGTYLEVDRFNKLAFSWESPFSIDGSVVTILFNETAEGGTHVNFTHVKFVDEEARNNHENGWNLILERLDDITAVIEKQSTLV